MTMITTLQCKTANRKWRLTRLLRYRNKNCGRSVFFLDGDRKDACNRIWNMRRTMGAWLEQWNVLSPLHHSLPTSSDVAAADERQCVVVGEIYRWSTELAVAQPGVEAVECERLVVDVDLVGEQLLRRTSWCMSPTPNTQMLRTTCP